MSSRKRRILILDDDRNMLRLLGKYLNAPTSDLVACSEIEAAECLMDRERFDVLVTDLEVSELGGCEGFRLVRHVRSNFPTTEVVVFSGKINEEVRIHGAALGVAELFEKPQDLNRLRDFLAADSIARSEPSAPTAGDVRYVETIDELLVSKCIRAVLQPIMALDPALPQASIFGVEGLSRGPEGSPLRNPEVFLDYASRKEQLVEIELQCIEAALVEARCLPGIGKLFINTCPRSLSTPDFAVRLCDLVSRHGYRESDIVLELTEQRSILNVRAFDATLGSLRSHGFGLALDDYGSGFANLHLVQQLNLDYVKIDGHFCQGIDGDSRRQAIVDATVQMARRLGVLTIMERVETAEELDVVQGLGVDFAQGYYFSPPLPGLELAASIDAALPIAAAAARGEENRTPQGSLVEGDATGDVMRFLPDIALSVN